MRKGNGAVAPEVTERPKAKPEKAKPEQEDIQKQARRVKFLPEQPTTISENALDEIQYEIEIKGLTPLIVHSKKGVKFGLEGKPPRGTTKPPFDWAGNFKDSLYLLPGASMPSKPITKNGYWPYFANTFGFVAKAFKDAVISVALQETNLHPDLLGTRMRAVGFCKDPNLVILKYSKLKCRFEYLPNPSSFPRTLMPVSRGEFYDWQTKLLMRVSVRLFGERDFLRMMVLAGEWIGVGDGRSEKSGYSVGNFAIGAVKATRIEHGDIGVRRI